MIIYSLSDPIEWARSMTWFLIAVALITVMVVSVLYMILHVTIRDVLGCE